MKHSLWSAFLVSVAVSVILSGGWIQPAHAELVPSETVPVPADTGMAPAPTAPSTSASIQANLKEMGLTAEMVTHRLAQLTPDDVRILEQKVSQIQVAGLPAYGAWIAGAGIVLLLIMWLWFGA